MKSVEMDFDGARWYAEAYSKAYDKLTGSIKNYMISTQSSLAPRTEQLKRNAYRAVTPVLISLLVMIAIVLMLYYFVSAYLVRPVLGDIKYGNRKMNERTGTKTQALCAVRISFLDIPEENTLHYLSGKVIKLKDPQIVKQFDGLDKNKQAPAEEK